MQFDAYETLRRCVVDDLIAKEFKTGVCPPPPHSATYRRWLLWHGAVQLGCTGNEEVDAVCAVGLKISVEESRSPLTNQIGIDPFG